MPLGKWIKSADFAIEGDTSCQNAGGVCGITATTLPQFFY